MLVQMDDAQLSEVHGQAYVLEIRGMEFQFKSFDERDFNGLVDGFFAFNPRFISKIRDGLSFVIPRVLGLISDRAGIDLGEVRFAYVRTE